MPRRGLAALALAALVAAAIVLALPYAASNRLVRDRIALEMSAWSGYEVEIGASPTVEIWPDFRAILTDVTLSPPGGGRAAIEAERVEIELSPLAALAGNVVFSTARLIKPTLRLEESAAGFYLLPPARGGRIARSVGTARGLVSENRATPDTARLPADAFGTVEFTDGRIVAVSGNAEAEIVSGLDGTVEWPALNRPAFGKAAGVWRGEEVSLDIASSNPLILLAGGAASISLTMRSEPASFRFDGTASLSGNAYVDGKGKLATPSLRKLLEWSHGEASANVPAGFVGVEADVKGDAKRVRFEAATVVLDDNPGQGVLDLILTGKLPVVSGTLAFETLDLKSFLSAFTPPEPEGAAGPGAIDAGFASRINLDLRLSAAKATLGVVELGDVAATAQVSERFAAFDISDATAFGGSIQAGIRFARRAEATDVEMRLLASDIDGGAFGAATGTSALMPVGRGKVSVILKGPGKRWDTLIEDADGSISANFGPGALSAFNLDAFLERAARGGFFALADVAKGTLPIEALDFKATVADGVATIDKAELRSARARIALKGIVPYAGRGLALSGTVEPAGTQPSGAQGFFVGGSWSAPFVSPAPSATQLE